MQAAAGSLARSALAACRHEPLSESARRPPWLPPTASVPPPRFACFVPGSIEAIQHASISRRGSLCSPMHRSCWHGCANAIRPAASAHFWCRLHRADDTLHVADGVDGRAHEARLPLWRCQQRQPHLVGSLFVRCPLGKAPARGVAGRVPIAVSGDCLFCLRRAAACLRGCRKSILRRRPVPAPAAVRAVGCCLWQTPSVPPIGRHLERRHRTFWFNRIGGAQPLLGPLPRRV